MARRSLKDTTLDGQLTPEQREFVKTGSVEPREPAIEAQGAAEKAQMASPEAHMVEEHKKAVVRVLRDAERDDQRQAEKPPADEGASGGEAAASRSARTKRSPAKRAGTKGSRRATVVPFQRETLVPLNVKIPPTKKLMLEEIHDRRRKLARRGEDVSTTIQDFVDEALEDWFEKHGYVAEALLEDYQKAAGE